MSESNIPLVVHVVYRLDYGGLENGLINLINNMPSDCYRHAIVCLTGYTKFSERIYRKDVLLYSLDKRPGKDLRCYWRMAKVLLSLRPDVLHTRNIGTMDMHFIGFLCGIGVRVHGEHGWDFNDLHGLNFSHRTIRKLMSFFVHRFVTVSADLTSYLKSQVGINKNRIHQIYSGVDINRFRPLIKGEDNPWPPGFAAPDSIIVGAIGRFERVKNHLELIRAFARLVNGGRFFSDRLRLVLVGSGSMQEDIIRAIDKECIKTVTWLPGARDDVPLLIRHLKVFVLPSLNEGISNTILEAMASGIPVIAANVGGNPEIVRHGKTGVLYCVNSDEELTKAIEKYILDENMQKNHGEHARKLVESTHSLQSMVNEYMELYDHVLKKGG